MKEIQKVGVYAFTVFLAYALIYLFTGDEAIITPFNDIALVIVSLIAAVLGYSSAGIFGWKSVEGRIFYILSAGISLYSLGELSWMISEVILGIEIPYPSIADLFWFLGLVTIIAAVYMKLLSASIKASISRSRILISLAVSLTLLSFSLYLVLIPVLVTPESEFEGGLIEKFTDLSYPTGEIIMMIGAIGIYAAHRKGTLGLTWGLLIAYIFISYIFDALFTYLTWNELYYTGHPIDLLYFGSYLLLILSLKNQSIEFKKYT